MKKKCTFSISDIDAGWFDISFEIEKEKIKISASDLWGNDSPKALLVMLTELLLEKVILCIYFLMKNQAHILCH